MRAHRFIPDDAWTEADERLRQIESENDVKVIYACESGSRAWGFPSADSDFDVRFIYVRPVNWYLSIDVETRRDVIETPIDGLWDVNGWDLRKALRLLRKTNPPLFEWLQSPIVYLEHGTGASELRSQLGPYFKPAAATFHYLHMAQKNYRDYLRGDLVRQKKYFYVLRPLLACRWVARDLGVVPMEFSKLCDATLEESDVREAIDDLLSRKREGHELDNAPAIPLLNAFIEGELVRHGAIGTERQPVPRELEDLSLVFRRILNETWGREV